jgi:hypothetical protein
MTRKTKRRRRRPDREGSPELEAYYDYASAKIREMTRMVEEADSNIRYMIRELRRDREESLARRRWW